MNQKNESIMDQPVDGMCEDMWDMSGQYPVPTEEAQLKIQFIIDWVVNRFCLIGQSVNITGSITSNSYKDDSDIDVHIASPLIKEENSDELNKELREEYEEYFKDSFDKKDKIKNHPIEVYFQKNPIQDLMSIGCYDFINKKWLVGPDLKDLSFDPYTEYYDDDMEFLDKILSQVRDVIFNIYELATTIQNARDENFKNEHTSELMEKLQEASDLFDTIANNRKLSSTPETVEQALKLRNSKKWKRADSSFKMMVDFGYIPILKSFKTLNNEIKENPEILPSALDQIISKFNLKNEGPTNTIKLTEDEEQNILDPSGDKIIFTNIDGVLCPGRTNYQLNKDSCKLLKNVCQNSGSKIVWVSNWNTCNENEIELRGKKYTNPMKEISKIMQDVVYKEDPVVLDFSPWKDCCQYRSTAKSNAIHKWLKHHKNKISNFSVLGTADFMGGNLKHRFGKRFIHVNPINGFDFNSAKQTFQSLTEGGHMFKNEDGSPITSPINQENVNETINDIKSKLLPILNIKEEDIAILGSTGKKKAGSKSSDIDIGVSTEPFKNSGMSDISQMHKEIEKLIQEHLGFKTRKVMHIISVMWPISNIDGQQEGQYVQVDLMLTDNIEMCKWGMYSPAEIGSENDSIKSEYKGAVRNILLEAIASFTDFKILKTIMVDGEEKPSLVEKYKLDTQNGLYKELLDYSSIKKRISGLNKTARKTKTFITSDPKEILKILFDQEIDPNETLTVDQVYDLFKNTKLFKDEIIRTNILLACIDKLEERGFNYPSYFNTDQVNIDNKD